MRAPGELMDAGCGNHINLHDYDLCVLTTSSGKDSIASIWYMLQLAIDQEYPINNIVMSHQDLGESEWPGVAELVEEQSKFFGLPVHVSRRVDKNGYEESLLEYVLRRGMWPANRQRFCTSEFKRSPGNKVVRRLAKERGGHKSASNFRLPRRRISCPSQKAGVERE